MRMRSGAFAAIVLVTAAAVNAAASAQPPERVRAGTLTCDISGGIGLIVASKKSVACIFTPLAAGSPREVYSAAITKIGPDAAATTGGEMVWSVFAPKSRPFGALAGDYAGGGDATVGAGLGANVLLGGSDRAVVLQPVSFQGQGGVNIAAGVAGLELRPAR
jgi:Protein of unknown function (DUF992)